MTQSTLARDIQEQLDASANLWEHYRNARVLLTGGTGMVGTWLVELFLAANAQFKLNASLMVLTRNPSAFAEKHPHLAQDPALTLHLGDVRHFLEPVGTFTHILHAATASSGESPIAPRTMADTILRGTQHVLDFARAHTGIRMLYVSSAAVYGRTRSSAKPIREDDVGSPQLTDPNLDYDMSKRMAEALCITDARAHALHVSIARCFALVGPHLPRDKHFAIGNFIRDALAGDNIQVNGDGTPTRSYLYLADVARYLWTVLANGQSAQAYNIGSPDACTMAELAKRVAKNVNDKARIAIAQSPNKSAPLNYQVPDTAKAAKELGLTPLVSLAQAIERTAAWYRANPLSSIPTPSILKKPDAIIFDFDGVMTDNRVFVNQEGVETVAANRSDGLGIGMLRAKNIPMLVLSKEPNRVVAQRCKKLGIECLQGIDHKHITLAAWLAERSFKAERVIYVGNDVNDLECMRFVGFPVAVGDAYPQVKQVAKLVLTQRGGHGAVRELVDLILGDDAN